MAQFLLKMTDADGLVDFAVSKYDDKPLSRKIQSIDYTNIEVVKQYDHFVFAPVERQRAFIEEFNTNGYTAVNRGNEFIPKGISYGCIVQNKISKRSVVFATPRLFIRLRSLFHGRINKLFNNDLDQYGRDSFKLHVEELDIVDDPLIESKYLKNAYEDVLGISTDYIQLSSFDKLYDIKSYIRLIDPRSLLLKAYRDQALQASLICHESDDNIGVELFSDILNHPIDYGRVLSVFHNSFYTDAVATYWSSRLNKTKQIDKSTLSVDQRDLITRLANDDTIDNLSNIPVYTARIITGLVAILNNMSPISRKRFDEWRTTTQSYTVISYLDEADRVFKEKYGDPQSEDSVEDLTESSELTID